MFKRQTSGSVVCFSCRKILSVELETCPHWGQNNPSLWGYARSIQRLGSDFGFLAIVTWGCIFLYVLTLLSDVSGIRNADVFSLLSPSVPSLVLFGASGSIPVFELGRWWTVLTAGWLHGNLLHIAFNLVWIRHLMPAVAQGYGAGRLALIYIFSTFTASLLSASAKQFLNLPTLLQGASISVGASGAVFGLLGALVSYGQLTHREGVKQQAFGYAVVLFFFGFVMANVDNWGHLGGFLGGYFITQMPWLHPQRSQRLYHLALALIGLLLTALSVIASVVHGVLLFSTP